MDKQLNQLNNDYNLKGKIQDFKGAEAIIELEHSKQQIRWPVSFLPRDTNKGEEVTLSLFINKTKEDSREIFAKSILNELLKTEN